MDFLLKEPSFFAAMVVEKSQDVLIRLEEEYYLNKNCLKIFSSQSWLFFIKKKYLLLRVNLNSFLVRTSQNSGVKQKMETDYDDIATCRSGPRMETMNAILTKHLTTSSNVSDPLLPRSFQVFERKGY